MTRVKKTRYFERGTISLSEYEYRLIKDGKINEVKVVCAKTGKTEVAHIPTVIGTARHLPLPAPNPYREWTTYKVARFRP